MVRLEIFNRDFNNQLSKKIPGPLYNVRIIFNLEIKYLENMISNSRKAFELYKKENVFNSATLREMFSPKYIYKGDKPNTVLVKSLKTNEPVELYMRKNTRIMGGRTHYDYYFYDRQKNAVGEKYFSISDYNDMISGYMCVIENGLYSGIGVREEEAQVKEAIRHGINYIPRSAVGGVTLYHTKMGYLPVQNDILEVESEDDVNHYVRGIQCRSKDLKPENLTPIVIEKDEHYYIDVSTTQAIANVKEIQQRLASGDYTIQDIEFLRLDGVEMSLSGEQFEYWKNLIQNGAS